MNTSQRVVLDTNVPLIDSIRGQAVRKAITEDQVWMSKTSLAEFVTMLSRKTFDRYLHREARAEFVRVLLKVVDLVSIVTMVRAEIIVSGDCGLLVQHPFRGIRILTPGA